MRAIYAAFCVAGFLATVGFSTPLSRQKRGVGAYAGGYTGVGTYPFPGAFAAAGFNPFWPTFNPFFRPSPFQFMNVPLFDPIPIMKSWYEGPNVCKQEKTVDSSVPNDIYDWLKDFPNMNFNSAHEQESCQGTNTKYACVKRISGSDQKVQIKATKYECCHGFVRPSNGDIGCVENVVRFPHFRNESNLSEFPILKMLMSAWREPLSYLHVIFIPSYFFNDITDISLFSCHQTFYLPQQIY